MSIYNVNIDFSASFDFRVKAKNKSEAKRKAWKRFTAVKRPRKYAEFDVEKEAV